MDILFRLRVLLWVMVLGLWGTLIHQFIFDDLGESQIPVMRWVRNPFPDAKPLLGKHYRGIREALVRAPAAGEIADGETRSDLKVGFDENLHLRSENLKTHIAKRFEEEPREAGPRKVLEVKVPRGFSKLESEHFIVIQEGDKVSRGLVDSLETLHGNLMLDLASFSPWGIDEKAFIYVFKRQETYRRITGRPAWSGGASSMERRAVYVFESDEAQGILAHELTHIYFDAFFQGGQPSPLWLSEGMATWIQVERGLSAPVWLAENLKTLEEGGGFALKDLVLVDDTTGASDDMVRLWYAQSYSIIRYLIREQWMPNFVKFCANLKKGKSFNGSLIRAYGKPFTQMRALELSWRANLRRRAQARRFSEKVADRRMLRTRRLKGDFKMGVSSRGFKGRPKAKKPFKRLGTSLSPGLGAEFDPIGER